MALMQWSRAALQRAVRVHTQACLLPRTWKMAISFAPVVNPPGSMVDGVLALEHFWRVRIYFMKVISLNCWHGHAAVDILCHIKELFWTATHLHLHRIMHQDWTDIKQAKPITFSKTWNMSSSLVCHYSALVDTMKATVSYAELVELEHCVRLVGARIANGKWCRLFCPKLYRQHPISCSFHLIFRKIYACRAGQESQEVWKKVDSSLLHFLQLKL